jgi:hypothetical protein
MVPPGYNIPLTLKEGGKYFLLEKKKMVHTAIPK